MDLNLSYTHLIGGISTIFIGLMYFYPVIFYIFIFLLYSMILIFIGNKLLHKFSRNL